MSILVLPILNGYHSLKTCKIWFHILVLVVSLMLANIMVWLSEEEVKSSSLGHIEVVRRNQCTSLRYHIGNAFFQSKKVLYLCKFPSLSFIHAPISITFLSKDGVPLILARGFIMHLCVRFIMRCP